LGGIQHLGRYRESSVLGDGHEAPEQVRIEHQKTSGDRCMPELTRFFV
jgi:hypothetical protein